MGRITAAFEAGRVQTTGTPSSAPEQVLVLEVAGELSEFARAVRRVSGLEFLAEAAQERVESGADFAAVDHEGKVHRYDRQLYIVVSDSAAWAEFLRLWDLFQKGEKMPYGKTPFRDLFARLEVLRPWDDRDRLTRSGVLDAWDQELEELGDELVEFEIELWFRHSSRQRTTATTQITADIAKAGGETTAVTVREDIGYHGILARVPARKLQDVVAQERVRWMRSGPVRFFHAAGQIAGLVGEPGQDEPRSDAAKRPPPVGSVPRLALLDGVPIAGHELLTGRIILDDPDEWESITAVERRNHGTAMASVVVHGDLSRDGVAQRTPVYVRPILWDQTPDWVQGAGREELPRGRLVVDVVHEAMARMFDGPEPVAPEVKVIVFAVGDAVCQFDRFVSPLARLLDWAQSHYGVLVLVSGGNHQADLRLPISTAWNDPQKVQHEVLCALQEQSGLRRLLSPGESINALTIGAAHADGSVRTGGDGRVEPMVTPDLLSVLSPIGGGVRGSVKPDVLLPGGRQTLVKEPKADGQMFETVSVSATRRAPGVRVAAPGRRAGDLGAEVHDSGTSPATGLAGYSAGLLLDQLDALRAAYGARMPGPEFDAVLVKAGIVHGASWRTAKPFIDEASESTGLAQRETLTRMVGYGRSEPETSFVCHDQRVTAVAASRIVAGREHAYSFPLPPSLASRVDRRRLTVTLAWISPVNPGHRLYRRAALTAESAGLPKKLVDRLDVTSNTSRRGTVQHDVLEGKKAVPFAPGDSIEVVVACRADAGALEADVPYAIIVTLEVPGGTGLPIYQEVRQRLRGQVAVRPPS